MPRGPVMLTQARSIPITTPPRSMARASNFLADIALLVGLPGPAASSPQPYVPPLTDVEDVLRVLQAPRARKNPPYVLSVLKSYVRPRVSRRRSRLEDDLLFLARACPEFAPEFRAIMKHYRLPLPVELLRGTPPAGAAPYHTLPRRRAHVHMPFMQANPLAPVMRLLSPTGDPPPPYASEDPDPDGTAIMALQLAAQSRIGLGDLAGIAQSSRVDLVQLAARSQVDLELLAQAERGEQEQPDEDFDREEWMPQLQLPQTQPPQPLQLVPRPQTQPPQPLQLSPPVPRANVQPEPRPQESAREEAWRQSLRALEGPPPRPPRSNLRPPAPRRDVQVPTLERLSAHAHAHHRRSTPTPPRAPRPAPHDTCNRATLNLPASGAVKRRLGSVLAKRASACSSTLRPPKPRAFPPLPIIPPLELGTLDFGREFADLDGWFARREAAGTARRAGDMEMLASQRRRTVQPASIRIRFDEPYDVEISSVMATEG